MKKIFLTLILSFAILSCETPNEEANSDLPTVIDDTELVAIADAMYEAMKKGQYNAVASNARALMRLIGLDQTNVNHNHGFKHGRTTTFYG